jgi:hypothetical protein
MADGFKGATFLGMAVAAFEVYELLYGPREFRQALGIAMSIAATVFCWQISRELGAGRKQALYYLLEGVLEGTGSSAGYCCKKRRQRCGSECPQANRRTNFAWLREACYIGTF